MEILGKILQIVTVFSVFIINSRDVLANSTEDIISLVKLMIEKGADIKTADCRGQTILLSSIKYARYDIAVLLIENGADITPVLDGKKTLLHLAVEKLAPISLMESLINNGVDVNAEDVHGKTPLLLAMGHLESNQKVLPIVELLIEKGANVNTKDKNGVTLLMLVMRHLKSNSQVFPYVKFLVGKGADPRTKLPSYQGDTTTLLDLCAKYQNLEMISFLIAHGAKIEDLKELGQFMADLIRKGPDVVPFVRFLIENGLDIKKKLTYNIATGNTYRSSVRSTLLHIAADEKNSTAFMKLLLENGADVNERDGSGSTVLMRSISKGQYENAKLLINNGADVRIGNENRSPLCFLALHECEKRVC